MRPAREGRENAAPAEPLGDGAAASMRPAREGRENGDVEMHARVRTHAASMRPAREGRENSFAPPGPGRRGEPLQ